MDQSFESGFEWLNENTGIKEKIENFLADNLPRARKLTEREIPYIHESASDIMNEFCMTDTGRALLGSVGFKSDKDGVFHVEKDCWQIKGGYNDIYDEVFHDFTSMDRNKVTFPITKDYDKGNNTTKVGEQITIWSWKGDYYNLGAGGETGIYKGSGYQLQSATDHMLPMKLTVKDPASGKYIINYSSLDIDTANKGGKVGKEWWITGFNPNYQDYKDVDKDSIVQGTTIDMSGDEDMWQNFLDAYESGKIDNPGYWKNVCVDKKKKYVYIKF